MNKMERAVSIAVAVVLLLGMALGFAAWYLLHLVITLAEGG